MIKSRWFLGIASGFLNNELNLQSPHLAALIRFKRSYVLSCLFTDQGKNYTNTVGHFFWFSTSTD
jgi:hypothetical protein